MLWDVNDRLLPEMALPSLDEDALNTSAAPRAFPFRMDGSSFPHGFPGRVFNHKSLLEGRQRGIDERQRVVTLNVFDAGYMQAFERAATVGAVRVVMV